MVGKGDDCTKYYSFGSLKLHAMVESDDEVAELAMCTFGHALCGPVLSHLSAYEYTAVTQRESAHKSENTPPVRSYSDAPWCGDI